MPIDRSIFLSVAATLCLFRGPVHAEFIPGHVFVSEFPNKHCDTSVPDWHGDRIWQVDPETGEVSLFAELRDQWCGGAIALAFTPNGTRLRVAQFLAWRIIELDADGTPTVVYDAADGIAAPFGRNSITFDRTGNFYVASYNHIRRFAAGAQSGEIYADWFTDPLLDDHGGSITVDASGDLYFARLPAGGTLAALVRFQGPHNGSLFEVFDGNTRMASITSDSCGNSYVGIARQTSGNSGVSELYKYAAGDPASKTLIGTFDAFHGTLIGLDPTDSYLNVVPIGMNKLFRLDLSDGSVEEIANLPNPVDGLAVVPLPDPPYGFTPCPPPIPAVSVWGMVILTTLFLIGAKLKGRP